MSFIVGGVDNWYDQYMMSEIELMNAYIEECEMASSAAYFEYKKYKKEHVEPIDEHHAHIWTSFRNLESTSFDLDEVYRTLFPALNRRSSFVTVFSMLEKNLYDLCNSLSSEFKGNDVDSYLKGRGSKLLRMKDYIHKKIQIPINGNLKDDWIKLRTLNVLRNEIVHNFGKLESNNKYLIDLIHVNPEISISECYNEIEFGNQFFQHLLSFFEKFYIQLQGVIRLKLKDK